MLDSVERMGFELQWFSFNLGKRLSLIYTCGPFRLNAIFSFLKVHDRSLSSHTSFQTILNGKKVSIFLLLHYWTLWIFPRSTLSENTLLPYATVEKIYLYAVDCCYSLFITTLFSWTTYQRKLGSVGGNVQIQRTKLFCYKCFKKGKLYVAHYLAYAEETSFLAWKISHKRQTLCNPVSSINLKMQILRAMW